MSGRQAKALRKKAHRMALRSIRQSVRPCPWFVPRPLWRALIHVLFRDNG